MTSAPPGRAAQSLGRAWSLIQNEFERASRVATADRSISLRDFLDHDLPVRGDIDIETGDANVVKADHHRHVGLAALDACNPRQPTLPDEIGNSVRELATGVRQSIVRDVAGCFPAVPTPPLSEWVHQIREALDGEPGTLWIAGAAFAQWMDHRSRDRTPWLPPLTVRNLGTDLGSLNAVLLPVNPHLLARIDVIPLTLAGDPAADPTAARLHAWCRYHLGVSEQATEMIRVWRSRPRVTRSAAWRFSGGRTRR